MCGTNALSSVAAARLTAVKLLEEVPTQSSFVYSDAWMRGFHLHSGDCCLYSSYGVNRDRLCGTNTLFSAGYCKVCLFVCFIE